MPPNSRSAPSRSSAMWSTVSSSSRSWLTMINGPRQRRTASVEQPAGPAVQVVGRLVQQQHVRLGQQQPGQRQQHGLAAGDRADPPIELETVEAEPLDGGRSPRPPGPSDRRAVSKSSAVPSPAVIRSSARKADLHPEHVRDGTVGLEDQVLRQVADPVRSRTPSRRSGRARRPGSAAGWTCRSRCGRRARSLRRGRWRRGRRRRSHRSARRNGGGDRRGTASRLQESGLTVSDGPHGTRHRSAGQRLTGTRASTSRRERRNRLAAVRGTVQPDMPPDTRDRRKCSRGSTVRAEDGPKQHDPQGRSWRQQTRGEDTRMTDHCRTGRALVAGTLGTMRAGRQCAVRLWPGAFEPGGRTRHRPAAAVPRRPPARPPSPPPPRRRPRPPAPRPVRCPPPTCSRSTTSRTSTTTR